MNSKLYFLFFFFSSFCFSQEDAWVYFKDKPNAQSYLTSPLTMLTQRALDRRTAQNIPLDISDVPIYQVYVDQVTAATGITVKAKSKWMNCIHVRGTLTNINAIKSWSFVDHIVFANSAYNRMGKSIERIVPVNKILDTQTTFSYGTSANQIQMCNGHILHQQNYTGSGKIIAVLDAGFPNVNSAAPFQRLISNNLILGGYDYVNKSSNFYTGNSHGTLVLSTMGGYISGSLVGTAPDASYYLFITEDVNSENPVEESNWVEAAEEADRLGVDIITSSLGYFAFDNTAYGHTYSDMTGNAAFASKGVNIAFSKGIVVVVSAGNDGQTTEPHVGVPAEALHALAIGAVQPNRNYALFSSVGPSYDGRIKPDVMAQGQNSVVSNTSGSIVTASGTSFSGPEMAGMIACFWQAVPSLTNQQLVDFVKQSSDRFANPDNQYGYGIPNFQTAITLSNTNFSNYTDQDFKVFPNPVHHTLTIHFPNNIDSIQISFYNTLGQLVLEQEVLKSLNSISLDNLNSGIYLYKIQSSFFSKSGKIIKE